MTLTEMDVASAKAEVANLTTVGDVDDAMGSSDDADQYWITSAGKFKFLLEELPGHLQLIYGFLKELYHVTRPDTQRHLLRCVEILCLHCEVTFLSAILEGSLNQVLNLSLRISDYVTNPPILVPRS